MRQQIIQEINDSLNNMEDTGVVDMSILDNLQKLRRFLSDIKTKWLEYPNIDAFYFYQAARNAELILGKMEERFKNSKQDNDNPKVAKDSLVLMRTMNKVLQMAETNQITNQTIDQILINTRKLRDTAAKTNLIEPLEIDRDHIDKDMLRMRFTELMNNLNIQSDDEYRVMENA